jgi:hypothetical protein
MLKGPRTGHAPKGLDVAQPARWATRVLAQALTTVAGASLVGWALVADPRWAERHVLGSYCATSSASWLAARAVPWIAAALGVLVIWRLAPALGRGAERLHLRDEVPLLLGIVAAVVAALGVGEVVARRQHDRLMLGDGAPPGRADAAMTRADPRLGWSYFPGRTTWTVVGDRRVEYAIDRDGDRARASDDPVDPARPTVLFAGESIAFGYGLPYDETFVHLVGAELGVQAVNLAVVGYGSDQAHRRVLDALPRFAHPLAVVTLFVPDQIERNVDRWRPRLGLAPDGALVPLPASGGPRLLKLLDRLPFHGDGALRVTAAILRATADAAREQGATPLFVVTNYGPPCLRDDAGEAWLVRELFVAQGLPFVRVELDPEDTLPGLLERHPGARGARKIADAVERALAAALTPPRAEAGASSPPRTATTRPSPRRRRWGGGPRPPPGGSPPRCRRRPRRRSAG